MKIQEDTLKLFNQDKRYVLDYLKSRGLNNQALNDFFVNNPFGLLDDASIYIEGEEFCLSHFLSKSDNPGYDIRKVNELLKTDSTDTVVLALVWGDDAICCDVNTEEVYLWKIQTGNGEKLKISDNLTDFVKIINGIGETKQ